MATKKFDIGFTYSKEYFVVRTYEAEDVFEAVEMAEKDKYNPEHTEDMQYWDDATSWYIVRVELMEDGNL